MDNDVRVMRAGESEKALIAGLAQFYVYDFSEILIEAEGFEFDEKGRVGAIPYFDDCWREADRHPLLIRAGKWPVGFALLNTYSHLSGGKVEHNMGEFFVGRKYRRHGYASEAVRQILARYPGRWEIAVGAANAPAQFFWPRAIASAPNVSEIVRHQGDGKHWKGPIWSFVAGQ